MATSVVAICNRALQKLGAKRITAITENSTNARACNACYETLRDAELRAHPWNFSIQRTQLAADSTAPTFGRDNAFTLPADFLKLQPPDPELNSLRRDWQIESGKIITNDSAPLDFRYVARITDPAQFDPLFVEALAAKMSAEMAEEITQSNTKKADCKDDYKRAIAEARRANAFDRVPQVSADDDWITARM